MTPELLAQLGLPATWRPVPVAWAVATMRLAADAGAPPVHVLLLDGPAGRLAYQFTDEEMRAMAKKIMEVTTGITLASVVPMNGNPPSS